MSWAREVKLQQVTGNKRAGTRILLPECMSVASPSLATHQVSIISVRETPGTCGLALTHRHEFLAITSNPHLKFTTSDRLVAEHSTPRQHQGGPDLTCEHNVTQCEFYSLLVAGSVNYYICPEFY